VARLQTGDAPGDAGATRIAETQMSQEHDTRPAERQAFDRLDLTDDDLALVVGGTDGPPGVGDHNGNR
jgi:hypothetical protein